MGKNTMKNGKKVLVVIGSIVLGGGAEKIAIELSTNLRRRGHDVTLLTFEDDRPEYEFSGKRIVFEKRFKGVRYTERFRIINRARKIAKFCKKNKIDVVISFMVIPNLSTILSKTLFRNKSKIIVSVRNNPLKCDEKFYFIMKRLYPQADLVVALSKGVEYTLKNNFSLQNTYCIHNLQNITKFKQLSISKIEEEHKDIFDENFVYVTIGRLTEQKGQWHLLRCFKKVSNNTKNLKLILIGGGKLQENLKSLSKDLEIDDKVIFLEIINNVFPYLKNADCFVFSSYWEGFGNVITEALSQNLPVISTDCTSGPREILCPELKIDEIIEYPYCGKYGVLTKPFEERMVFKTLDEEPLSDEENIFADTMIKLYIDKNLRKKNSNGLQRAKDFDVDKIIEEWEKLLYKY